MTSAREGVSAAIMTVEAAAAHLGCGRTQVFALIRDGAIRRARKLGRRTMVFRDSVEAALLLPEARETPAAKRAEPVQTAQRGDGKTIGDAIRRLPLPPTLDHPGDAGR
jgi:excisionase family DNA binding protein